MKRTWFQAQIKHDIAISAQFEHERHSTHKRGSCIAFLQKKAIHKHIQHIIVIKVYRTSTSLEPMIQMQPMIQRCKHDMIHKWKCNMYMYINPPNRSSKPKIDTKPLVRISANYFLVSTWMRSMFPFSTLSLRKWYLASICLVLECSTGFLATLMALVTKVT
jgi:hypothetical protein